MHHSGAARADLAERVGVGGRRLRRVVGCGAECSTKTKVEPTLKSHGESENI